MYMEYQNNLVVVEDVLVNPAGYDVQGGVGLDGMGKLECISTPVVDSYNQCHSECMNCVHE